MDTAEIIGYVASFVIVAGYIPQIYQGIKTKHTKDLSLPMVTLFFVGSILWATYGFMIGSAPIWVTNVLLMICQLCLFYLKFRYGGKK